LAFGHAYSVANVEQTCRRLRFMQRIHFSAESHKVDKTSNQASFSPWSKQTWDCQYRFPV